jgi:hypothetical protein
MQENEVKAPVKSVVQIYFPAKGTKLAYLNGRFDLQVAISFMSKESWRDCAGR